MNETTAGRDGFAAGYKILSGGGVDKLWKGTQVLLLALSALLSAVLVAVMLTDRSVPFDYWTFSRADELWYAWGSEVHGEPYSFRYSPLFALAFPEWLGLWGWRALHVAVLFLLPWKLILLTLAFAPFWYDVLHGNVMTFVMVAGWFALRGNRYGTWAFLAWCVLVPRPLMLPLFAWLVWKRPETRIPAAVAVLVGLGTLAWPGYLDALLSSGGVTSIDNLAPSAWIGVLWIPVGLALGAWLTWKGRVGLAGLAVSPYVLPYYLLTLGWELRQREVPHVEVAEVGVGVVGHEADVVGVSRWVAGHKG